MDDEKLEVDDNISVLVFTIQRKMMVKRDFTRNSRPQRRRSWLCIVMNMIIVQLVAAGICVTTIHRQQQLILQVSGLNVGSAVRTGTRKRGYATTLWWNMNEHRRRPFIPSRTRTIQQLLQYRHQLRSMVLNADHTNSVVADSSLSSSSPSLSSVTTTTNHSLSSSSVATQQKPQPVSATSPPLVTTMKATNTVYDLGVGKHLPIKSGSASTSVDTTTASSFSSDDKPTTVLKTVNGNESLANINHNAKVVGMNWMVPESVVKPSFMTANINSNDSNKTSTKLHVNKASPQRRLQTTTPLRKEKKSRRMVARDNEGQILRAALWDEQHYDLRGNNNNYNRNARNTDIDDDLKNIGVVRSSQDDQQSHPSIDSNSHKINGSTPEKRFSSKNSYYNSNTNYEPPYPKAFYPDIDLSIPDTVYSDDVDLVWDLLRYEAYQNQQQQYEPLLVSFLHSTILNHDSLESSLAFLLANRLQSPAMMISTQLQALILSALQDCAQFRRKLRADIMAVRDRDPACHTLPDVFLYFKGFHALQSHRTAHVLWNSGRTVLAQYLQSQVSQIFQIDIHPNATIGSGIMLDHGTGIVIGETATVGHNCSILHHVTLGGSGKKGVIRHPAVGNGVLLGAGATVLGPITIGDGCQIGAGTLVISDLPSHCVAVGVPARIIGSFVDVTEQPSIEMDQIIMECRGDKIVTFESDGI